MRLALRMSTTLHPSFSSNAVIENASGSTLARLKGALASVAVISTALSVILTEGRLIRGPTTTAPAPAPAPPPAPAPAPPPPPPPAPAPRGPHSNPRIVAVATSDG